MPVKCLDGQTDGVKVMQFLFLFGVSQLGLKHIQIFLNGYKMMTVQKLFGIRIFKVMITFCVTHKIM